MLSRRGFGLTFVISLPLLLLPGCVSPESWEATRLLQDIDAAGGASELKSITPAPQRRPLSYDVEGRPGIADLYHPGEPAGAALVLVPGFTEQGRRDWRLVELARSLARARFLVLVPEVPGSRQLQVRLEDSRVIADAVIELRRQEEDVASRGLGLVAISYGVGLALLAALELETVAPLDFLVGLGGYYDASSVVTFATTGRFRLPGELRWRRGAPEPAAKWIFLASNAEGLEDIGDRRQLQALGRDCFDGCDVNVETLRAGLSPQGRALVDLIHNRDPAKVPPLIAALPQRLRQQLRDLSPSSRDLTPLTGRLVLIHGKEDTLIPYSESLALAQAVPKSELFLIDGFSHITPDAVGWGGQLQLIDAVKAVLARRRLPGPD
jgi:pimeloyl-ACP methyl ester carboxylesterase